MDLLPRKCEWWTSPLSEQRLIIAYYFVVLDSALGPVVFAGLLALAEQPAGPAQSPVALVEWLAVTAVAAGRWLVQRTAFVPAAIVAELVVIAVALVGSAAGWRLLVPVTRIVGLAVPIEWPVGFVVLT
ncbi:hypothetical protein [Ammoniphilus resinae]|uniref:Sensor histidine kinase n=1 Tax=Ammoniphilus resinae TaxID=861532 RepID=A0ABS4GVI7_9BACL|nr:hypothetical protein [Ammoniphilus resinae]MBP1934274.1 hypothetical protein [Ammoniphilus resinae]